MHSDGSEDELLRSVALQNARAILLARERAEREALEARQHVTRILESITDGFYALDREWRFTYVNQRAKEMLDPYRPTRHSLIGRLIWAEFPRAQNSEFGTNLRRALERQVSIDFEAKSSTDDRWFEIRVYPSADGLSVYFRDISERRRANELRSQLAAVVESSDDAIISMGLDTIITTWNKGAERMFGYTAQEILGQSIIKLLPPGHETEEPQILQQLLNGERVNHYETIRVHKDGKLLNVSLSVSPVYDADGRIVGVSKISRDITERKRVEDALREAQSQLQKHAENLEHLVAERTAKLQDTIQELESFSYSVSHDMRSPLRAMQGYAVTLLEDYKDKLDPTGQEYLRRIQRAASRMDLLIQDVLAYSRVAKGEIQLIPIQVESVIHDLRQNYPAFQPDRLTVVVHSPLPLVRGHEAYLTQIISNLLGNAAKFVPPEVKPQVEVTGSFMDGMVRISFKDNGIGIAPQHQAQIFQIFGRVYPEKKFEGTGIGLAIVKKAAERMGGSVGVVSELGKGSEFFILLQPAFE